MTSPSEYNAVRVHVESMAPGLSPHGYTAHYETFVLTANDPVMPILPEDQDRVEAFVMTLDNDIVIGTRNQVSAAQNTNPGPIGAYVPAKTTAGALYWLPVKDCNAVFAGATTTGSNSRVSVVAYYRSKM